MLLPSKEVFCDAVTIQHSVIHNKDTQHKMLSFSIMSDGDRLCATMLSIVMTCVVMPSVVMLSVVMPSGVVLMSITAMFLSVASIFNQA
jgi:hypothetical protein